MIIPFKKICGFCIGLVTFSFIVQSQVSKKPLPDKATVQEILELNKYCPLMVDNGTRIDSVIYHPDNILEYRYTLTNVTKGSLNIDKFRSIMEPDLLNGTKTKSDLKKLRDINFIWYYTYYDKNGVILLKITITPEQYK
jgi:hypothetical protein